MLITGITTKTFCVLIDLYMFLKIFSSSMAALESIVSNTHIQSYFGIYIVFIYNLLVWSYYSNFIKEFNNLFYLSMPIGNGT